MRERERKSYRRQKVSHNRVIYWNFSKLLKEKKWNPLMFSHVRCVLRINSVIGLIRIKWFNLQNTATSYHERLWWNSTGSQWLKEFVNPNKVDHAFICKNIRNACSISLMHSVGNAVSWKSMWTSNSLQSAWIISSFRDITVHAWGN